MLRTLLTAFRQQYPQGSLVSDLVQVHDGLYVVRVVVAVEDRTLATGMAAHTVLETAEDTAYARALSHLGSADMGDGAPPSLATPPISSPASVVRPQAVPLTAAPDQPAPVSPEPRMTDNSTGNPVPEVVSLPRNAPTLDPGLWPQDEAPALENQSLDLDFGLEESAMLSPDPNATLGSPSLAQDLLSLDGVPTPSIDLSDIIAQTDVELQRLGWNVNQGREFLEKTYGKVSRHYLTDEELLEFLLFLETQPTPGS